MVTIGRGCAARIVTDRKRLPGLLMATASVLSLLQPHPATAKDAGPNTASVVAQSEQAFILDIPAKPLPQSIADFSAVTGIQVLYTERSTFDQVSSPLIGTYTIQQALELLVEGSGLVARYTSSDAITIEKPSQSLSVVLDAIFVEGDRLGRSLAETEPSLIVIDGAEADNGINQDLREATDNIPNLVYEQGPYLPSIRGIDGTGGVEGGTAITAGSQPRIPITVDGISLPTSLGATTSITGIWDVESVEVARGPQATTTGRNAIGGAIRVFTKDPVYEQEFAARLGYFNQDGTLSGAAMANVPVLENTVAVRLAAAGLSLLPL